MIEIALQTKIFIGIIALIVFYFLLKKTMENISSTNNDDDTVINLDKMSKSNREKHRA